MLRTALFAVFLQLAYCVSQPGEIQQPPGKREEFRLLQCNTDLKIDSLEKFIFPFCL